MFIYLFIISTYHERLGNISERLISARLHHCLNAGSFASSFVQLVRLAASLPLAAMARPGAAQELAAVKLGLGPAEAVLRGGALRQPTIFSEVVIADGKQWIRLRKSDQELRAFLVRGDGGRSGRKKKFPDQRSSHTLLLCAMELRAR